MHYQVFSRRYWFSILFIIVAATLPISAPFADIPDDERIVYEEPQNTPLHEQRVQVLEAFLQNTVPGLDVSYRDVFDAFIAEGHVVYLKGGVIRDLFSATPKTPHDVDFVFSGSKEDVEAIVIKNKWQYNSKPGKSLLSIGDRNATYMEGVPKGDFLATSKSQLEFTINTIFYNVNTKKFILNYNEGFNDLQHNRLRIQTKDWNAWLYGSLGSSKYTRLFRVWKMIGKGFIYEVKLERYIRDEALKAQKNDSERFHEELHKFLCKHYQESFADTVRGGKVVMGDAWVQEYILPLEEEAKQYSAHEKSEQNKYTYFQKSFSEQK